MTELLKQNFLQFIVMVLGAAVLGLFGWIFLTSNNQAKLQTQIIELQRERVNMDTLSDKLSDARQNIRVLQVETASLKEILAQDKARMDLHGDRLTNHDDKPYHTEGGIELARINQKIKSMNTLIEMNKKDHKEDLSDLRSVLSNLLGSNFPSGN